MKVLSVTLEEVAKEFEVWRQNRKSKVEPTPGHLKQLANHLLSTYSRSQIMRTLGIGSEILDNLRRREKPIPDFEPEISFTSFRLANSESNENPVHNCEILRTDGNRLIIKVKDIDLIVRTFLCFSSTRSQ